MVKAFWTAIGISAVLIGLECLALEKVTWRYERPTTQLKAQSIKERITPGEWTDEGRVFHPADHHPWMLIASGLVMAIWARTLPQRLSGK